MVNRILGVGFLLLGGFLILVAATSRTPEGHPLAIAWFMSILGFSVVELGLVVFFDKEQ